MENNLMRINNDKDRNMSKISLLKQRKISQERIEQKIDFETGEVKYESVITSCTVPREPNFIKIYLDDVMYFIDMPSSASGVLLSIAKRMSYDNKVTLVKHIKEDIAKETNLDLGTINNLITNFKKKNILISSGRSVYIINPNIIGKGAWEDIFKLRMEIEYTEHGKIITTKRNDDNDENLLIEKDR